MIAIQKLMFVVLLVCFLIKKNCQILTSRLGKTGHHQQKPSKKWEKNDPLPVTLGSKVLKLWPMKVCHSWLKSQCACTDGFSRNFNLYYLQTASNVWFLRIQKMSHLTRFLKFFLTVLSHLSLLFCKTVQYVNERVSNFITLSHSEFVQSSWHK